MFILSCPYYYQYIISLSKVTLFIRNSMILSHPARTLCLFWFYSLSVQLLFYIEISSPCVVTFTSCVGPTCFTCVLFYSPVFSFSSVQVVSPVQLSVCLLCSLVLPVFLMFFLLLVSSRLAVVFGFVSCCILLDFCLLQFCTFCILDFHTFVSISFH